MASVLPLCRVRKQGPRELPRPAAALRCWPRGTHVQGRRPPEGGSGCGRGRRPPWPSQVDGPGDREQGTRAGAHWGAKAKQVDRLVLGAVTVTVTRERELRGVAQPLSQWSRGRNRGADSRWVGGADGRKEAGLAVTQVQTPVGPKEAAQPDARAGAGPAVTTAVGFFRYSAASPDVTILLGGCLCSRKRPRCVTSLRPREPTPSPSAGRRASHLGVLGLTPAIRLR